MQIQAGRLYHLGVRQVKKSTRADANNNWSAEFVQALFEKVYQRCTALAPGKKNSSSITNFTRWVLPPLIFACLCSLGPGSAQPRAVSSCRSFWIMIVISRNLPEHLPFLLVQLLPQTGPILIKTFFGTSRNAVLTQIWIALITMLVLSYMKFLAKLSQAITQIQRLLQLNLFKRQAL